ncbi:MAG: DNA replication/repair protein RecF [Bacilli bacterium]|nr:DNA replication/repair protein RecF [Bacilli bacterium]
MVIKKIKLINFRNYKNLNLKFSDGINIIIGNNAQGKTNILESIYTLALTKSYRTTNDFNLIRTGQEKFIITGDIKVDKVPKKMSIELYNNKKMVKINDNIVRKISDYIGNLVVILSSPEDLNIIKGSPIERRNFLNIEISQKSNIYLKKYNEFNKLLKMRNDYLKLLYTNSIGDYSYLDILTNNLIEREIEIYKYRNDYINDINKYLETIYYDLSDLNSLKMKYITNIDLNEFSDQEIRKQLENKYKKNLQREITLGMTLYGPHRDDFQLIIDNEDIKIYGSQGQQKLAFIALKFAEIKIFEEKSNIKPIILLDDIFSELDKRRKNNLIKYINSDYQTIITSNDIKGINKKIINNAKIFKIYNNSVIEEGGKDGRKDK